MITVAAAIIKKDGKYLAARKKDGLHLGGYWEFPGGKVETGETPRECLRRELIEELGIHCEIGEYLGDSIYDYGSKQIRLLGYFASTRDKTFRLTDHDLLCWLPPVKLKTILWAPADISLVEMVVAREVRDRTLHYYNSNAADYICQTRAMDMSAQREAFTRFLPDGCRILDIGCGSGRDSRAFLDSGYKVTAIEPSAPIAEAAAKYLGQSVGVYCPHELHELETYDGIWACASLIHIHQSELTGAMEKVARALRPGGILYMSWKLGHKSEWDSKGRYINRMTMAKVKDLMTTRPELTLLMDWETKSALANTSDRWLNLIYQKRASQAP